MKRFHVNVAVTDVRRSIEFYKTLFGEEPVVVKPDYAKWMLEDPRVNFAISESSARRGINHVGVQAETLEELDAVRDRLRAAEETTLDQEDAKCCYARSSKSWVRDPDDVVWEAFVTHDQIDTFGEDRGPERIAGASRSRCCG